MMVFCGDEAAATLLDFFCLDTSLRLECVDGSDFFSCFIPSFSSFIDTALGKGCLDAGPVCQPRKPEGSRHMNAKLSKHKCRTNGMETVCHAGL